MAKGDFMNTQYYIAKCAEMAMKQVLDDTTIDGISIREWIDKIVKGEYKPVVYARAMKIFDNPYTGRMFTTCSACDGKISPNDTFCKHCGATMIKG